MNVWCKQFTRGWLPSSVLEELHNKLELDRTFLTGESWGPKIGATLNIRRPARFEVNRIA